MQLKISNVGKIENAIIDVNGITVIAGENNAGKSTIGKTMFAIFNSMNNMDEKIAQERKNRIRSSISWYHKSNSNKRNKSYRRS